MKYRSEIDGLRAFAVIPVILFHGGVSLFSGGYIGVDIFFVISGYLITTILIEDINNKSFSLSKFYSRRAKRILPALFFVMIVCIPFAWAWMLPTEMKFFSNSLIAVSFFISNMFFWKEKTDYFAKSAEENPLLHTWSLAIEEQYYIFFPILLFIFWKISRDLVFYLICLVVILSLCLNEWAIRNDHLEANFYFIFTRAWELLAGSIAAFIVEKKGIKKNEVLSLIGPFAILFSFVIYDKTTPIPSVYALIPVLGTVFIILYADKETFVAKLLSLKIFVAIGLISYSAYLWHQPLFAFAKIKFFHLTSQYFFIILSLISLLLGSLSWKYIEQPFRKGLDLNGKKIFIMSFCMLLFFSSFGYFGNQQNGFVNRFEFIEPESPIKKNKCHGQPKILDGNGNNIFKKCLTRDTDKTNIFVLGDSHAAQTYTAINYNSKLKNNFEINFVNKINAKYFPHSFLRSKSMNYLDDETLNVLFDNLKENDLLIISIYLKRFSKDPQTSVFFERNMEDLLKYLENRKIKVVLQISNPTIPHIRWIQCYDDFIKYQRSRCGVSKENYLKEIKDTKKMYEKICNTRKWCNVFTITELYFNDEEWFEPMKNWSYVDLSHLSKFELERLGDLYLKYLNKIGYSI